MSIRSKWKEFREAKPAKDSPYVRKFYACWRGRHWLFSKNWYAFRWGEDGAFHGERMWLADVGMFSIGWVDDDSRINDKDIGTGG